MAAQTPEKTLQAEVTCSVCLDYFQDPMMIVDCGHSFCRACIEQCYGSRPTFGSTPSCPQCRQTFYRKSLLPNRHLWSLVELAKQFSERRAGQVGEPQELCPQHREPLQLFCRSERVPICVVCDRSRAHKDHCVVPLEEAAQGYQDEMHHCLQTLKGEREKVSSLQAKVEKPMDDLLKEIETEKQNLVSEFQKLHQLLEKEEQQLLTQLKDLEREVEKAKKEKGAIFSEEISQLSALIGELEQKSQEPQTGLVQDVESILNRCKKGKFQPPGQIDSSEFKRVLQAFSQKRVSLQDELKKNFREIVSKSQWIKEYVTFDPETAHARFEILDNQRSITLGNDVMGVPYNAKRFDPVRCALGSYGFSSGKHYWTVDVSRGSFWAIGVARESVNRKGQFHFVPEEGVWAVGLYNGRYKALTSPPIPMNLSKHLEKIRICLDYEGGTVAFADAKEKKGFTFFVFKGEFAGEKIFPFFRIGHQDTWLFLY